MKEKLPTVKHMRWEDYAGDFRPRQKTANKGDFGHVLIIGGNYGMPGSVRLVGEAALRVGAGLVTIATRPEHIAAVVASRPELMCHGVKTTQELDTLIEQATVLVIGNGLGQDGWAQALWTRAIASSLPMVVDADALNLLSQHAQACEHWILTPHPGEASRLLKTTVAQLQSDRPLSITQLQQQYGGVSVLKGAGSLVKGASSQIYQCDAGNPGMSSAGMGDVLSGVIGGLLAQGLSLDKAAQAGVLLHSLAADKAAKAGERGLLALDVIAQLRELVNP